MTLVEYEICTIAGTRFKKKKLYRENALNRKVSSNKIERKKNVHGVSLLFHDKIHIQLHSFKALL